MGCKGVDLLVTGLSPFPMAGHCSLGREVAARHSDPGWVPKHFWQQCLNLHTPQISLLLNFQQTPFGKSDDKPVQALLDIVHASDCEIGRDWNQSTQ